MSTETTPLHMIEHQIVAWLRRRAHKDMELARGFKALGLQNERQHGLERARNGLVVAWAIERGEHRT